MIRASALVQGRHGRRQTRHHGPYADITTGQLIITIAEPFSRGNTDGVIAGDVSIDGLVKDVLAMNSEGTYAILVDSNGTIIAHPDKDLTLKPATAISPELTAAKVNELAHDNTISEMDISGKASVFDLTGDPQHQLVFRHRRGRGGRLPVRLPHGHLPPSSRALLTILIVAGFSYVAINGSLAP